MSPGEKTPILDRLFAGVMMGKGPETSRDPCDLTMEESLPSFSLATQRHKTAPGPSQYPPHQGLNVNPHPAWSLGSQAVPGNGEHGVHLATPQTRGKGSQTRWRTQWGQLQSGTSRDDQDPSVGVGGAGLWPWALPQGSMLARLGVLLWVYPRSGAASPHQGSGSPAGPP